MKHLVLLFLVAAFVLVGCNEEATLNQDNPVTSQMGKPGDCPPTAVPTTGDGAPLTTAFEYCGTAKVVDLFAGQDIDAGSVTIYNDVDNLYVTVYSQYGYQEGTEQLAMWVGGDLLNLPMSGGQCGGAPINGQFEHKMDTDGGTTYTFTVPLDDLSLVNACGDLLYVVVHANVLASRDSGVTTTGETAYGGNTGGTGNRWWYYTSYNIQCCENPPMFDYCTTAYAKGGYVWTTDRRSNPETLPSLNLTKNRWGWAIKVTTVGTTTYDIWAGAGLNNTGNGTLVGTLTVTWDSSIVTVTYDLADGKTMQELHIYAGDGSPATIAPGQYGYTQYFDPLVSDHSATFDVSDTNGDGSIWVVAHAVACWNI